jgi:Regulator of chromosome condensation (RCC1) repeat
MKLFLFSLLSVFVAACSGADGNDGESASQPLVEIVTADASQCAEGGVVINSGVDTNANSILDTGEIISTHIVCNGDTGGNGVGYDTLFVSEDEAAGINCPYGGKALHYGRDMNLNNILDAEEREGVTYVCNGTPGVGFNSLISVMSETVNCPNGGQAIRTGLDDNSDGLLQPSEVDSVVYVCNGLDGSTSLIRRADEFPGLNCEHGGQAVFSGLDIDKDDYLDATEIQSTSYVCNGADGADGADGYDSLFSFGPEPVGVNCANAGKIISTGLDVNLNGVLDSTEILNQAYVCNGVDGATGLNTLVNVVEITAGATCAAGGQRIESGLDLNVDSNLDAGEITLTKIVCNGVDGATGINTLVNVTVLPVAGICVNGGQQIESGLDLDADSNLDSGEVTTTEVICNGLDGINGVDGATGINTLVNVVEITAGATCAAGGQLIETGFDLNADSNLDSGEIQSISTVCNGATGINTLVNVTQVPDGTECEFGGQRIESGLDLNEDTILAGVEITTSQIVCNGLDGGVKAMNITSAMLNGVCIFGGIYIETGMDLDKNGTLDSSEVTETQYVCNQILEVLPVVAGFDNTCGILVSGKIHCRGDEIINESSLDNSYYKVSTIANFSEAVHVRIGRMHACALKTDGSVWCWGRGSEGQLGNNDNIQSLYQLCVENGWNRMVLGSKYRRTIGKQFLNKYKFTCSSE